MQINISSSFGLSAKGDETYMMHLLVGNGSVILQDVVVGGSSGCHELLDSRLSEADRYGKQVCSTHIV